MKSIKLCNGYCCLELAYPYPLLGKCKLLFPISKILQYGVSRRWVKLFPRYPCNNCYKNWYLHFFKTHDHKIWQAGTSTGVESSGNNQAGADEVITSWSRGKLKALYFHLPSTHNGYFTLGHMIMWQTKTMILLGRVMIYLGWLLLIKSHGCISPDLVRSGEKIK